ncbi:MAG: sigma-70 family RNA polymerase sigma factor [Kofleriaceae bacterium]
MDTTAHRLISQHAELARRIALKMARRCPDWVAREDLVAAGLLGLTEAAQRYDESREEPFVAFAEHRIRGAVMDELRRGDVLPRRVRQLARKVGNAIRELEVGGESATDERIADALGVSVDHYRTGLASLVNLKVESLDASHIGPADPTAQPDEQVSRSQLLAEVRTVLEQFPSRDVTILGLHYIEELSYSAIAEMLGITAARVCQITQRALHRLRVELGVELELKLVA